MADQGVAVADQLAATERLREAEAGGGGGHHLRHLGATLAGRGARQRLLIHHAGLPQQGTDRDAGGIDGDRLPVRASLDQAGDAAVVGTCEHPVIDQPRPAGVALVGHHHGRRAEGAGEAAPLFGRAAEDERLGRPQHRVQVDQDVDIVEQRPQLAGPVELGRRAGAVEDGGVPEPVHVLLDEAGRGRLGGIEALERRQVQEADRQPAPQRAEFLPQQLVQHDRAGELVAVHQRGDRDMRTRPPAVELHHPGQAGIAGEPVGEVRRPQPDIEARQWRHVVEAVRQAGGEARHRIRPRVIRTLLVRVRGGGAHARVRRVATRRMKPSQASSWLSATHSSGRCAWAMSPGPQTMLTMPAFWKMPASVP